MPEISQTESEIKIIIKLINIRKRKPDVVLLKRYIKFNCPPTFFEAHLTDDIDEEKSYCKLFKSEARIILSKVNPGLWENIYYVPENKSIALEMRKEMVDELQKKNVQIEEQASIKFDEKKRKEVEREIEREGKIRDKVQGVRETFLKNELGVTPEDTKRVQEREARENKKKQRNFKAKYIEETSDEEYNQILEKEKKEKEDELERQVVRSQYFGPKINKQEANVILQQGERKNQVRQGGQIKISFTKFNFKTPKRESQQVIQDEVSRRKQMAENNCKATSASAKDKNDNVD